MIKIITDAQYKFNFISEKTDTVHCKINGVECSVPMDEKNTDYAEILRQVKEGTLTIKEVDKVTDETK